MIELEEISMLGEPKLKTHIGQLIKKHRQEKKFTQQDLANALDVDRQYVSKIEKGKINMTIDYLENIITKKLSKNRYWLIKVEKTIKGYLL